MPYTYKSSIPQGVGEIMNHLAYMMLSSPAFVDPDFIGRDLETAFSELDAGLGLIRDKLGEGRYAKLIEMSKQMRAHFEADPQDSNGQAKQGRKLIREMEELLTTKGAAAKA